MEYKAIIFDNAGVLINESHKGWSKKIADHFDQPFEKIYKNYSRDKAWLLFKTGKITEEEFWQRGNKKAGLNLDIFVLKKYARQIRRPYLDIVDLLYKLSKKYLLVLVNNEAKEWDMYSRKKEPLYKLIEIFVSSWDIGVAKPEKGIYQVLVKKLDELNIKPEKCIYIDDREDNLRAAEKFGIKTILFKNSKELEKNLFELKVI